MGLELLKKTKRNSFMKDTSGAPQKTTLNKGFNQDLRQSNIYENLWN
jgi:hypothetical protein